MSQMVPEITTGIVGDPPIISRVFHIGTDDSIDNVELITNGEGRPITNGQGEYIKTGRKPKVLINGAGRPIVNGDGNYILAF